ncbi:MAG: UDP-N-acetyl-D-mannosaminuronic acid dehydrogenase [Candidatus Poribacteria bacterium]|nr:UDP-N-acetyl-D-mannosaminuronic acid dehydrogenase [Candidatus Poribacteria bacterium]
MKICVVGMGYIGLPTSSILATHGFEVIGVEINKTIIDSVEKGRTEIQEPGLSIIVKAAVRSRGLKCQETMPDADVFIICVPTPINQDKTADLDYVIQAGNMIAPRIRNGNLVILESTVPPGTTRYVLKPILERSGLSAEKDFYLAHCPERVLPGNLLNELIHNDRIIGGINETSAQMAKKIYETFVEGNMYLTDTDTAEFVKLMENTYRAVNIALANEFALISEKLDLNIHKAIDLANKHPRVNIPRPGAGVGGHCIPIDPWFIVEKAPDLSKLITTALKINEEMPEHVISLVKDAFDEAGKKIDGSKVTILGVAYKSDVNDARETPATPIIKKLTDLGANIAVYDPLVVRFPIAIEKDLQKAVFGADAIVIVTDHSELKSLDPTTIRPLMKDNPILIDGRNIFESAEGFIFRSIGR